MPLVLHVPIKYTCRWVCPLICKHVGRGTVGFDGANFELSPNYSQSALQGLNLHVGPVEDVRHLTLSIETPVSTLIRGRHAIICFRRSTLCCGSNRRILHLRPQPTGPHGRLPLSQTPWAFRVWNDSDRVARV